MSTYPIDAIAAIRIDADGTQSITNIGQSWDDADGQHLASSLIATHMAGTQYETLEIGGPEDTLSDSADGQYEPLLLCRDADGVLTLFAVAA